MRPRVSRRASALSPKLDLKILAYTLGAAGTVILSQPAQASIVFTNANTTISNGSIPIDLNADGIVDFRLRDSLVGSSSLYYQKLTVIGAAGAKVIGQQIFNTPSAWAAPANWSIGPGSSKGFVDVNGQAGAFMAESFCSFSCFPKGPWRNKTNRFLGLEFNVNGEIHYGWARLTVQNGSGRIKITLTGYAYETTPNQSIVAGDRGPSAEVGDSVPRVSDPSLGMLSAGSAALPLWRRAQP